MSFYFNTNSLTPSTGSGGGGGSAVITSLNVIPTTSAQTITATSGVDGYSPVNVSAVTSAIDANIIAGNIKDGVTILGVTGNYTGSGGGESMIETPYEITGGEISLPNPDAGFSFVLPREVTEMASSTFGYAFADWQNIKSASFPSLVRIIGDDRPMYGFSYTFANSGIENAYFPSLEEIGDGAFQGAFQNCQNLTSIEFPSLRFINGTNNEHSDSGYTYAEAFAGCDMLVYVEFPVLESITSSSCFYKAFQGCSMKSISFPSLRYISGQDAFISAFSDMSGMEVSFPALTSDSFDPNDGESVLEGMFAANSDSTVHFPSNLQSVIGNWNCVTNGFDGENITVLFDLPATE